MFLWHSHRDRVIGAKLLQLIVRETGLERILLTSGDTYFPCPKRIAVMATDPVCLFDARIHLRRITRVSPFSNLSPGARGGHHPRKPTPWIGRSKHTVRWVRKGARRPTLSEKEMDGITAAIQWPHDGVPRISSTFSLTKYSLNGSTSGLRDPIGNVRSLRKAKAGLHGKFPLRAK